MLLGVGEDVVPAGYGVLKAGVISQPSMTLPDYITAIPQVPAYDPGMSDKPNPQVVAAQKAKIAKQVAASVPVQSMVPVIQYASVSAADKVKEFATKYKYPLLGIGIAGLIWMGMRK